LILILCLHKTRDGKFYNTPTKRTEYTKEKSQPLLFAAFVPWWKNDKQLKMKKTISGFLLIAFFLFGVQSIAQQSQSYQGIIGKTFDESKEWWPEPVKAPADAPNIIWILIDDVGFGSTSTFGGIIPTPIFDSLANNGLRYTNFHTCAICAPTRASLLTGRNSGTVHMSGFAHYWGSAGFPGWDGYIPEKDGTVAEILKQAGYTTFAVGKYGVTPDAEATDAGPFDYWPLGKGFDHFFGFLGSETDQYHPALVQDNAYVEPDGRHLSEQITDKAISYIDKTKNANPDKPFFLYYAPGATQCAPHQVPDNWS
jgi:arylsulfatase